MFSCPVAAYILKILLSAINKKKRIALANKETLVTAGHIIMPLAKEYNVSILPVDSEHSAIYQLLDNNDEKEIRNLIITASGGALRDVPLHELKNIKAKLHRNFIGQIKSATVSQVPSGKYYVSLTSTYEIEDINRLMPLLQEAYPYIYEKAIEHEFKQKGPIMVKKLTTNNKK